MWSGSWLHFILVLIMKPTQSPTSSSSFSFEDTWRNFPAGFLAQGNLTQLSLMKTWTSHEQFFGACCPWTKASEAQKLIRNNNKSFLRNNQRRLLVLFLLSMLSLQAWMPHTKLSKTLESITLLRSLDWLCELASMGYTVAGKDGSGCLLRQVTQDQI